MPGNLRRELAVLRRVHDIDAMPEECDSGCTGRERAPVRGRVDPGGQAADDAKAALAQVARELECVLRAAGRRVAAADDREAGQVQHRGIAVHVQRRRRVCDAGQQSGVVFVLAPDQGMARSGQPAGESAIACSFVHAIILADPARCAARESGLRAAKVRTAVRRPERGAAPEGAAVEIQVGASRQTGLRTAS